MVPRLSVAYCVGARALHQSVQWLDDTSIGYVSGSIYVIYNTITGLQRHYTLPATSTTLTAATMAPGSRFVAVAGRGAAVPQVAIHDTVAGRVVLAELPATITATEIVSLSFSADTKSLVALTGGPDHALVAWSVSRGDVLGVLAGAGVGTGGVRATMVGFPIDVSNQLVVAGKGLLSAYQILDSGEFRPVAVHRQPSESLMITSMLWVSSSRCLLGRDDGTIAIMDNFDIRSVLPAPTTTPSPVDALAPLRGGFCAVRDGLRYSVYAPATADDARSGRLIPYTLTREAAVAVPALSTQAGAQAALRRAAFPTAVALAVNPAGTFAALLTSTGSLLAFAADADPAPRPLIGAATRGYGGVAGQRRAEAGRPSAAAIADAMSAAAADPTAVVALTSIFESPDAAVGAGAYIPSDTAAGLPTLPACHLVPPACAGGTVSVAAPLRRPVFLSAGADRSLTITNYLTGLAELTEAFPDDILAIACHPTGMFCAVAFSDRVRAYCVTENGLALVHEFHPRQARALAFSHGGHLLAIAASTSVTVFSFTTYEKIGEIRGHNARVSTVAFGLHDATIVTGTTDGAAAVWATPLVDDAHRVLDVSEKTTTTIGALVDRCGTMYTVSGDRAVRAVRAGGETAAARLSVAPTSLAVLGAGATTVDPDLTAEPAAGTWAVVGSDAGTVTMLPLTLPPVGPDHRIPDLGAGMVECTAPLVGAGVAALAATAGGRVLAVAGADGCLVVCSVDLTGTPTVTRSLTVPSTTNSVILSCAGSTGAGASPTQAPTSTALFGSPPAPCDVSAGEARGYLTFAVLRSADAVAAARESRERAQAALEAATQAAAQLRTARTAAAADCAELREQLRLREEAAAAAAAAAAEKISQMTVEQQQSLATANATRLRETASLEERFDRALSDAVERNRVLEEQLAEAEAEKATILVAMKEEQRIALAEAGDRHQERLQELSQLLEAALLARADATAEHVEREKQQIEDADEAFQRQLRVSEADIAKERTHTLALKAENDVLQKRQLAQQRTIDTQKGELSSLAARCTALEGQLSTAQSAIADAKNELAARDSAIAEKESRILELRNGISELEKLRFVLNFKVRELRRQIGPRETELAETRAQVDAMSAELLRFGEMRVDLELRNAQLTERAHAQATQARAAGAQLRTAKVKLSRMEADIARLGHITSPKELRDAVAAVYKQYCEDEHANDATAAAPAAAAGAGAGGELQTITDAQRTIAAQEQTISELRRQRAHLERAVAVAERRVQQETRHRLFDTQRAVEQNVELVGEVNALRTEAPDGQAATLQRQRMEITRLRQATLSRQLSANTTVTTETAPPSRGRPSSRLRPKSATELPQLFQ